MKKLSTLFILSGFLLVAGCVTSQSQSGTSDNSKKKCSLFCKKNKAEKKDSTTQVTEVKAKQKPIPKWVSKQDSMPYQPTETRLVDLLHTKLEVSFDWEKQYLYGKATLSIKPYFYSVDSVFIDAKGFDINKVALVKDSLIDLSFGYDSSVIAIKLDKKYKRTEKFDLFIDYVSKPNQLKVGGSDAITSDKGLYFINPLGKEDKPKQIWTQGETEASSCWFPTIDIPNEKTTQEMYITIDTTYTVLTNGEKLYEKINEDNTKTEYWRMTQRHTPYLFMMAIGEFAVVEDKWGDIKVDYYVEPKYEDHAMAIFGNTPEMMTFYSDFFGVQYPWAKYSQVCVRDYVSGAMENTTATLHMAGVQRTKRELLDYDYETMIAHELAHHWFGDLVTCESWSNLPLNESFANYSEYLWLENKYGRKRADAHSNEELEGYLREAYSKRQEPLIRYHYNHREDMFDRHSYNKGGRVLHMLRKFVGDDAFKEALKLYLNQNQYEAAEIHHLRLAFEKVTGQDLNWFFNQWFLKSGHPVLKVDKEILDSAVVLNIKQIQDPLYTQYFKIPLTAIYKLNGQVLTYDYTIKDTVNQSIKIPTDGKVDWVLFDSEQMILGEVDEEWTDEEAITLYNQVDMYMVKRKAIETLTTVVKDSSDTKFNLLLKDEKVVDVLLSALDDDYHLIRKIALDSLHNFNNTKVVSKVQDLLYSDSNSHVRASALRYLASLEQVEDYRKDFKQFLSDSSYLVISEALTSYIKAKGDDLDELIPELMKIDNRPIAQSLLNYFTTKLDTTRLPWILEKYEKGDVYFKYYAKADLAKYLKVVTESQLIKAFDVLEKIAADSKEHRYSRYAAYIVLSKFAGVKDCDIRRKRIFDQEKDEGIRAAYQRVEGAL